MPYTHRTPKQRAALERQAKALRAQGAAMAEIERATGVPVSTLYQWAARGGWRGCDLAREALDQIGAGTSPSPSGEEKGWGSGVSYGAAVDAPHPTLTLPSRGGNGEVSGPGAPSPSGSQGRPPARSVSEDRLSGREGGQESLSPTPQASQGEQPSAASGACPRAARNRPTGGEGGQETNVSSDALRSAGERALAAALQLAQAGQAKAARDQLLLGQRFVAAAQDVSSFETEESAQARLLSEEAAYARAELESRLLNLIEFEDRKRCQAIGLDQIEGLDLEQFDFEPFRIGEDEYRRATPEELAQIRAGLSQP